MQINVEAPNVTLIKTIMRAAVVAALVLPTAPAFAGEREQAFMQSIAGSYRGSGEIRGEDGGPVNCRLTFRPSGAKLNYTGRCSGGGGSQSFSGIIRYNDEAGRWESSSRGKTVRGRKSGSTLSFSIATSDSRGSVSSTMSISPGSARVRFEFESRRGERSSGSIPFSRV
jgi:hypothetical protein